VTEPLGANAGRRFVRKWFASMSPADENEICQRALQALARNRNPGYHFGGHFLDLQCRRFEAGEAVFELEPGPHCVDVDGTMNLGALLLLADMTLSASNRLHVDPTARTATLVLRIEFTGAPALGLLRAESKSAGFSPHTALAQAASAGTIRAAGSEVARMSGIWVAPPAAEGHALNPLPWERKHAAIVPALALRQLDPLEKNVMRRVRQALRAAPHGGFLRNLWQPAVRHTPRGAASRLAIGMHVGNRVGHVQGGLLLNAALATAIGAVPHHPLLTAASAWFISPGQGKALRSRSTVLQKGRNVAVVRTEVFAVGGRRVLEAVSNHAIAARP
jgi:acyl-coenzyme A thioesterase PaaI-like protein